MTTSEQKPTYYISITGLKLKSFWYFITFWKHAIASKMQADRAQGAVLVQVKRINGVEHTLTVWKSKDDMRAFLTTGAHLKAMKSFRRIATGKTFGYEGSEIPTWEQVHSLWLEKGKEY